MKKLIVISAVLSMTTAGSVFAQDLDNRDTIVTTSAVVSQQALGNMEACLNADMQNVTGRAVRACSKAIRDSIPSHALRSQLYTQRGMLYLSSDRQDKASKDFVKAANLNGENEFAFLGSGYAALMNNELEEAKEYFLDCTSHDKAAPMAMFGLGVTKALAGDKKGAMDSYKKAMDMRPDWEAPAVEYEKLASAI